MANNVDPDQTPRSAASDLGLHCMLWQSVPIMTWVKYNMSWDIFSSVATICTVRQYVLFDNMYPATICTLSCKRFGLFKYLILYYE